MSPTTNERAMYAEHELEKIHESLIQFRVPALDARGAPIATSDRVHTLGLRSLQLE